ncbi:MAG: hypothetical protein JRF42_02145 [Deltaproteobacteria bacterium]|nr:hypothetical protein [Deltaproteobacteria bacterium]
MLNGDHRVAVFDELMENCDQLFDVDEVQAAGGLIEDERRRAATEGEVA